MSLLNTSISGLRVSQQALSTVSHNISNVNTPGYSRQTVTIASRDPTFLGGFFVGNGSSVLDINRSANELLNSQIRDGVASLSQLQTFFESTQQIDTLLSSSETGIGAGIDDFFSNLSAAIADPASIPSRQAFLSQADGLTNRFNLLDRQLNNQASIIDQQIKDAVVEVNALAQNLADVNFKITSNSEPAPDLLDKRDELLKEISKRIGISSFTQDDGSANVFIASGQSLVVGRLATSLATLNGIDDPTRTDIAIQSASGSVRIDRSDIQGGVLGGLVNLRTSIIEPAIRTVNRLALGVGDNINLQHRLGIDLNGNFGGDFFNSINARQSTLDRSVANPDNAGSAALAVNISSVSALKNDDYEFTFNGANSYTLRNLTDNTTNTFSSLPTTIDGFTLSLDSGALASGDRFFISPARFAARDISLSVVSPSAIALADPIRTNENVNNTGSGEISLGQTVDVTNASFATAGQLTPPTRIEFLSETTYSVVDANTGAAIQAGPIPYNPAISNDIFPAPAMHVGAAGGLVAAGTLPVLTAGELTLNGTSVGAATADGVSTTDATASGIAIAAAVNSGFNTHGVSATVNPTSYNLGTYTTGTIAAGEFQINGRDIVVGAATQAAMLTAINGETINTGVAATVNGGGEIILTAQDGRNIQLNNPVATGAATFTNLDLTTAPDDFVQRSSVTLSFATGNLTVGGTAPADGGFAPAVYNFYDPGYRVSISGAPVAGDSFEVSFNTGGVSDSRNGLAMTDIQISNNMDSGTNTLNGIYSNLLVDVGSAANQANLNSQTAEALTQQLEDRRDSISGVNLDEEAADLLRFQQAYQANAQVISTAGNIINILFDVIR